MNLQLIGFLFLGASVILSSTCAMGAATLDGNVVRLQGCPVQLSANCIMMLDKQGTPYDITSSPARSDPRGTKAALPSPNRRLGIQLDGVFAEGEINSCKRGIKLKEIHWRYTKEKCSSVIKK